METQLQHTFTIIHPGPIEFNIHGPMLSGSHEAAQHKYQLLVGKSGRRWLVADNEAAGENVYVEGGPNSDGFAGRILTFELVSGDTLSLKGPWHSNPDALFADTGHDVRDKHRTQGIIALRRERGAKYYEPDKFYDVIYYDEAPVLGTYNRVKDLAEQFAEGFDGTIFVSFKTKGGGLASWAGKRPK